jgi:hypothetical protein
MPDTQPLISLRIYITENTVCLNQKAVSLASVNTADKLQSVSITKNNHAEISQTDTGYHTKVSYYCPILTKNRICINKFYLKSHKQNVNICPDGVTLICADRQTKMAKVVAAFNMFCKCS